MGRAQGGRSPTLDGGFPAVRDPARVRHWRDAGGAGGEGGTLRLPRGASASGRRLRRAGRRRPARTAQPLHCHDARHGPGNRADRDDRCCTRGAAHRSAAGRQTGRDLAPPHRIRRARLHLRRCSPATRRIDAAGVAAPRQLDLPGVERDRPQLDLCGPLGPCPRARSGEPRLRGQRTRRLVHGPRHGGVPGRSDQYRARHQHRRWRPDAPKGLPLGGARFPRRRA